MTPPHMPLSWDAVVVGGGINGSGIARDLAGRGWRVMLVEQDDLASHTSSASTKLIHGGLRYLEHGAFGLVRKALQEREHLMRSAPHLIRPMRFVLPHNPSMRPAWMLRLGLFFYDHLAAREILPGSEALDLRQHPAGRALQPSWQRGFAYSDGWVDDARLVLHCALDAQARGAHILTRTRLVSAQVQAGQWSLELAPKQGAPYRVQARMLVNAAGPFARHLLQEAVHSPEPLAPSRLRLVQGAHIVVPRCLEGEQAYLFQNPDGRILFAIPYEDDFTLIGTTDHELPADQPPGRAQASDEEVDYLCTQASRYLRQPLTPAQVVWRFAGLRPLLDDAQGNPAAVTRDYRLELRQVGAPLLNVWGGKITTFRRLAEEAGHTISQALGATRLAWTQASRLPGADFSDWIDPTGHPVHDFRAFVSAVQTRHPWLPPGLSQRWTRSYGSRLAELMGSATQLSQLGAMVAPGLTEAELDFLRRTEWAHSADDVLWRRSKLGLHLSPAEREAVARWLGA